MLGLAGALLFAIPMAAQTGQIRPTHAPAGKHAPSAAPAPSPPVPPARRPARPAAVTFAEGQLHIQANNSSLARILDQISHETGIAIDGLSGDQRIYGDYGPGPVAGTLSKLLDATGYNYIIVGAGPGRLPSKLLLTAKNGAGGGFTTAPGAASASKAAPQPAPATPPASANPSAPAHPKSVQQIFNELRRAHPPK